MLKRIFKSLAWGLLTTDIYYRCKQHHAIQGHAPEYALVKAWKKESYDNFMKDPNWWDRITFREVLIMSSIILILTGMLLFLINY